MPIESVLLISINFAGAIAALRSTAYANNYRIAYLIVCVSCAPLPHLLVS